MSQAEILLRAQRQNPYLFSARKRLLDVVIGSMLAGLSYPIEAATVAGLRLNLDAGPIYLKEDRLGATVNKLRTMLRVLPGQEYDTVRESSRLSDRRVPRGLPQWARKYRLDEIPQLRQAVGGGLQGGVPRTSLVGLRPLRESHADEFYEEAWAVDPGLADRWRYQWQEVAPRGPFSPAACHFMERESNEELDVIEWMRREDEYCRTANEITDVTLIGNSLVKIGMSAGRHILNLVSS